jgi:RNA polymerase sigma factor (sigma-70 family)
MTDSLDMVRESDLLTSGNEEKWIESEEESASQNKLNDALSHLSDRQREIIYMKYYQQMEYEEIGRIMGLNYQSARNLVTRALSVLRKEMLFFVTLLLICP